VAAGAGASGIDGAGIMQPSAPLPTRALMERRFLLLASILRRIGETSSG
jgi:hypothetical protein